MAPADPSETGAGPFPFGLGGLLLLLELPPHAAARAMMSDAVSRIAFVIVELLLYFNMSVSPKDVVPGSLRQGEPWRSVSGRCVTMTSLNASCVRGRDDH